MRSVTIESCTEGFLVWNLDEIGQKTKECYAVSQEKMVQKVKELLGITEIKSEKPKDRVDILRVAAKELVKANPKPFISDSSDSTEPFCEKASPKTQSKIETKLSPSSPFAFKEVGAFEVSVQPITKGKAIYWLHPGGKNIKISREAYKSIFIHANISDLLYLYEHLEEQKSITHAYGRATYENKAVVLRGFLKDVPLSALVSDNHNDVVVPAKKEEPKGQEDGCCDEVYFESCINGFTAKDEDIAKNNCKFCIDQSRYENKNKIAAKKPSPPLMKAHIGV
jgi:hypothetical protein